MNKALFLFSCSYFGLLTPCKLKMTIKNTLKPISLLLVLLCTANISLANFVDSPVVLDSIVKVEPTCGLNNGMISIFASGSANIFYSIDNGLSFHEENVFENMGIGDYSIQVTNGLSCVLYRSIQLTNGPQVDIASVDVSCNEQNVSADINLEVENGIPPFSYVWEGPSNFNSSQEDLLNIIPGEYRVTITDNVGCKVIDTIQIPICCGLSQGLELFCPSDLYLECGNPDNDQIINDWLNAASANDGLNNALIVDNDFDLTQTAFCEDILTINFTTRDQCDNTTACRADILIADINVPTINCPADLSIDFIPGENLNNIENWLATATASDNCTGAFVEHDFDADNFNLDCQNGSSIKINFIALDQCQNTDMCSAILMIGAAPLVNLNCNSTLSIECDSSEPNLKIQDWINNVTAIDDHGNEISVNHDFTFLDDYSCGEEFNIQFSAIDHCGTALSCSSKIQIVDTKAPEINCDNHLNISAYANNKPELIEQWLESIQALDNCSDPILQNNFDPSSLNYACGEADTKVVRFEAIDQCGNQEVCLLSINIMSSEILFNIPPPMQLECGVNNDVEITAWLNKATATDQYGLEVYLDNDLDASALNCSNEVEVSFQYQNPCGDLFESTSSIILIDNTAPDIICPEGISIQSYELPSFDFDAWIDEFKAEDLCSNAFLYNDFDYNDFDGTCKEFQVVHFVAEDDCGNISECIVDIRIADFALPEIQCPDDIFLETSNPYAKEELDAHLEKIISNTNSTLSFEYSYDIDYDNLQLVFQSRIVDVKVTATNECDEFVSCSFKIHINAEATIFAPSIFSPNADGNNDRFTIFGNNHLSTVIKLSIYDRLGSRMQHLTNIPINHPSLGWDGTFQGRDCAMGVYAYHAVILDFAGNELEFVGSITLVR